MKIKNILIAILCFFSIIACEQKKENYLTKNWTQQTLDENCKIAYTTKEEVAKDVWKVFQKKKTFQVTGWKMRIIYATRNFVPAWLMRILMKMETDKK